MKIPKKCPYCKNGTLQERKSLGCDFHFCYACDTFYEIQKHWDELIKKGEVDKKIFRYKKLCERKRTD